MGGPLDNGSINGLRRFLGDRTLTKMIEGPEKTARLEERVKVLDSRWRYLGGFALASWAAFLGFLGWLATSGFLPWLATK